MSWRVEVLWIILQMAEEMQGFHCLEQTQTVWQKFTEEKFPEIRMRVEKNRESDYLKLVKRMEFCV